jgi:hypothetical protein
VQQTVLRIWIRIILGGWIRIRIKVEIWILIRMKVKRWKSWSVILEYWRLLIWKKVSCRIRIRVKLIGTW